MTAERHQKQADGTVVYRDAQGRLHRDDGPAIERADGGRLWYIDGLEKTEVEFGVYVGGFEDPEIAKVFAEIAHDPLEVRKVKKFVKGLLKVKIPPSWVARALTRR